MITSDRLQLENVSILDLDIAFDVNNKGYLKELNKHYIKYSSKKIKLYKGTKFKEEEPEYSYYIGANKYINIYDKIAELKSSKKNYIVDYYKQNSFDMKKGVTRLELRLNKYNGGFIARITRNIDLLRIIETDYLGNIAKEVFDTKLWYFKDDNLNRSRRTRKRLLEIDYSSYKKEVNYSSTTILKVASDRKKKTILKTLTFEWLNDTGGEDADNEQYKRLEKKIKLFGLWVGDFGNNTLELKISEIVDDLDDHYIKGVNTVKNNSRDVLGDYTIAKGSKTLEAILEEPGDNEYDGVFHVYFDLVHNSAKGTWKSNNGKLERSFTLVKNGTEINENTSIDTKQQLNKDSNSEADSMIDKYETYVKEYVSYMQKLEKGDLESYNKSITLMNKANNFYKSIEKFDQNKFTVNQINRLNQINMKMLSEVSKAQSKL